MRVGGCIIDSEATEMKKPNQTAMRGVYLHILCFSLAHIALSFDNQSSRRTLARCSSIPCDMLALIFLTADILN